MGLRETLEAATRVGEWHVDQDEPWRVRAEDGYPVAFCGTLPGHPDPSPWRAEWSAHLIALAPELATWGLDVFERHAHLLDDDLLNRWQKITGGE